MFAKNMTNSLKFDKTDLLNQLKFGKTALLCIWRTCSCTLYNNKLFFVILLSCLAAAPYIIVNFIFYLVILLSSCTLYSNKLCLLSCYLAQQSHFSPALSVPSYAVSELLTLESYVQAYMQKTCDVAEKTILAKKKLRKKCLNRDKM